MRRSTLSPGRRVSKSPRTEPPEAQRALINARLERIVLHAGSIDVHLESGPGTPLVLPWSPTATQRQRAILQSSGTDMESDRGIKAEARAVLLRSFALGRRWLAEVLDGSTLDQIATREGCTRRHIAKTIPLAFLAPDLVRSVIEARLPRGLSTKRIGEPELEWSRQWERLGIRR